MKRHIVVPVLVMAAVAFAGAHTKSLPDPTYSVAAVKGKLLRLEPEPEERLQVGSVVEAGSLLRTGWRSSATIASPQAASTFLIGTRTRFRTASGQPGVLLELDKGRARAIFDAISEGPSPERIVTTPSAMLAVRGTEYGVAVSRAGNTSVVVFSGVVAVTDRAGTAPAVMVSAGQYCDIAKGKLPGAVQRHGLGRSDWDHGKMPHSASGQGAGSPSHGPRPEPQRGAGGSWGHGG